MTLTEIREYLERNNESERRLSSRNCLTPEELDYVSVCCEHINKWYYEDYPLGGFLSAIVRNDLVGAVFRADAINSRALKLYAYFLTWNLPADWREKAISKAEGGSK